MHLSEVVQHCLLSRQTISSSLFNDMIQQLSLLKLYDSFRSWRCVVCVCVCVCVCVLKAVSGCCIDARQPKQ